MTDSSPNSTRGDRRERSDTADRRPKCPICGKVFDAATGSYPFCSKRCRQVDLGRWLGGDYVISRPVEEKDLDEGE